MKLKIILLIAGIALVGSTVVVILNSPRRPQPKFGTIERDWPTAVSNYSNAFKLNTNPPIWSQPANGRKPTN
jgi:hypothetical protein